MKIASPIACALAGILMACGSMTNAAKARTSPAAVRSAAAPRADGFEVRRGPLILGVTALTDDIVRVRIGRNGTLPEDASWAVLPEMRARRAAIHHTGTGFATRVLRVSVDPRTLELMVTDPSGKTIIADSSEPISFDGKAFTLRKRLPPGEHIYGLGDKTGGTLDRRGRSYVDWNTDAYGFDSSTDPIYKSIPFFISTGG